MYREKLFLSTVTFLTYAASAVNEHGNLEWLDTIEWMSDDSWITIAYYTYALLEW